MAFPNASYVGDVVIKTKHGRRRNRFYYGSAFVPTHPSQMETLANGIFATYAPAFRGVLDYSTLFEKVELKYYGVGGVGLEGVSSNASLAGLIAPDAEELDGDDSFEMPDESVLIIRVSTGKTGRSKRGRRFISGISEALNKGGEIEPVYAPECIALATLIPQQVEVEVDVAGDPVSVFLDARHYDRKNNVMEVLQKCWALNVIGSRRDRRKPIENSVLVTLGGG